MRWVRHVKNNGTRTSSSATSVRGMERSKRTSTWKLTDKKLYANMREKEALGTGTCK